MAVQRAASPALGWVALFLVACAVLGLTLGFKDQIRRNPPAWYTGGREKAATGAGLIEAKEATAFDPEAARPVLQVEEDTAPKPKAEEAKTDDAADDAATPPAAETPKPKAATPPPPKIEPPSEDPVGDLLDAQKKAPETPPTVPY